MEILGLILASLTLSTTGNEETEPKTEFISTHATLSMPALLHFFISIFPPLFLFSL